MPRPAELLHSTPVRLALALVFLVSAVGVLTFSLAYLTVHRDLESNISANIDLHVAGFRVAGNADVLADLVTAEAEEANPADRVFVFIRADGHSFGNAQVSGTGRDITLLPLPDSPPLSDAGYISRVIPVLDGLLVVGESRKPLRDLENTFINLAVFTLVPTFLISIGGAVLVSLNSARRVRRIETTLERLAGGDLGARVAVLPADSRRTDDLARIGAGIDQMAAAQESATAALRQVSGDIAHDLKTPIQRISLLLSDLRDRLPDGSAEADIASRASAEAERAVAVFQSLLQIVQIEGGGARSRFVSVNLADTLRTFAEIYEPSAEDSGHFLVLSAPPSVLVSGDKSLLGQVIANLIENTLRHTPQGTRIDLALSMMQDRAVLSVSDNGPGIPAAERDKVLQRLYRLDRSRSTPGNGLGLSLVAAIAELHGAELTLGDNKPGLRVTLTFPPVTRNGPGQDAQRHRAAASVLPPAGQPGGGTG